MKRQAARISEKINEDKRRIQDKRRGGNKIKNREGKRKKSRQDKRTPEKRRKREVERRTEAARCWPRE
jgi:hypothetical protein